MLQVHGSMNEDTEQLISHLIRRDLDISLVCYLLVTAFTNIYPVIVVIDILITCFLRTLSSPIALICYSPQVLILEGARDNSFFSKHLSFEYQTNQIEVKDLLMCTA